MCNLCHQLDASCLAQACAMQSMKDKEVIVGELAAVEQRITGTSRGSKLLQRCLALPCMLLLLDAWMYGSS